MKLVGKKIIKIRLMTDKELDEEDWDIDNYNPATVIELNDGIKLYASRDGEGNGPGVLFGCKGKNTFSIYGKEVT